jgi:hypothetical protein
MGELVLVLELLQGKAELKLRTNIVAAGEDEVDVVTPARWCRFFARFSASGAAGASVFLHAIGVVVEPAKAVVSGPPPSWSCLSRRSTPVPSLLVTAVLFLSGYHFTAAGWSCACCRSGSLPGYERRCHVVLFSGRRRMGAIRLISVRMTPPARPTGGHPHRPRIYGSASVSRRQLLRCQPAAVSSFGAAGGGGAKIMPVSRLHDTMPRRPQAHR